jgi:hypothetical protein
MPDAHEMAQQEREGRAQRRWEHARLVLERAEYSPGPDEVRITRIKVILPARAPGETLVVVQGKIEETALVAFHRGDTSAEALAGALNRYHNGGLKWREDEYA